MACNVPALLITRLELERAELELRAARHDELGAIEREDLEPGGDAEATAVVVDGGQEREARARA